MSSDYYNDEDVSSPDYDDSEPEPVDESGYRNTWEILTWIIIALTILLNLILIAILVFKRNLRSIVNKRKLSLTKEVNFHLNLIIIFSNICCGNQ